MKTTILKKEHERAIYYLMLIDKLNLYIDETKRLLNIQYKRHYVERFILYSENDYQNDIIRYEKVLSFCEQRYSIVMLKIKVINNQYL